MKPGHAATTPTGPDNDVALLTLSTPAPAALEPLRVIETGETALWQAGVHATVVGWGKTESVAISHVLLEATVPMRSDAFCGGAGSGARRSTREHGLRGRRDTERATATRAVR